VEDFHPPQNYEPPPFFGMVAAAGLELWHLGHVQWHDLPTEFHKNLPNGSKIDGGETHRMISLGYLFPFRKERRLKIHCSVSVVYRTLGQATLPHNQFAATVSRSKRGDKFMKVHRDKTPRLHMVRELLRK
jgi:hypothetical protein